MSTPIESTWADRLREKWRLVVREAREKNRWRKIVRFRLWMPIALQIILVVGLAWYTNSRFPGFLNGANINFGTTKIAASLIVKNTISIGTLRMQSATMTDVTNNSWQNGRSATASDFVSIDRAALKGPRKPVGSLPDIDYLKLKPTSPLCNAGVDVGLPFDGPAPDIGPFESAE